MHLPGMLEEAAAKFGGKTLIVFGGRRASFSEIDTDSNRLANALLDLGIKKGDRVAMLLSNSPEFVKVYFGIVKCGAIAVPLDTKYKITELKAVFQNCQPQAVFIETDNMEGLADHVGSLVPHVIDLSGDKRFLNFARFMAQGSLEPVRIEIIPDDVAHIAYTSGPTLRPHGIMLSHRSLITETMIAACTFQQTENDRSILFALPMHHAFGLVVILFPAIYTGSTIIMISGLSIGNLMETIEKERATLFMAVPFIHALINDTAEEKGIGHDISSLRFCGSAGSTLPVSVQEKFERLLGKRLVDFWGQTEASAFITCQSLNGDARRGSVGKALPGWEVKIVDENNKELPVNQVGEIVARGPITSGVFQNTEATARLINSGWLHTGDLARIDDEGNVFLCGNKRGMLITKGQNIFPGDVEDVLAAHPKVIEAVVVGLPDGMRGQVVGAAVRLKPGEIATDQEMKHYCMQNLANYKIPKQIIFIESVPRYADGQVNIEAVESMFIPAAKQEGK